MQSLVKLASLSPSEVTGFLEKGIDYKPTGRLAYKLRQYNHLKPQESLKHVSVIDKEKRQQAEQEQPPKKSKKLKNAVKIFPYKTHRNFDQNLNSTISSKYDFKGAVPQLGIAGFGHTRNIIGEATPASPGLTFTNHKQQTQSSYFMKNLANLTPEEGHVMIDKPWLFQSMATDPDKILKITTIGNNNGNKDIKRI